MTPTSIIEQNGLVFLVALGSQILQIAIVGLCALRGVGWLARAWRTHRQSPYWRDALVSLGIFAAALALRWLLPPHAPFHEHGDGYITLAIPSFRDVPSFFAIPTSYMTALWLLFPTGPGGDVAVFAFGAVMSSLAPVGIFWLVRLGHGSRLAALTAGWLVATLPLAIKLGPTEISHNFTFGVLAIGMALLWHAMERGGVWPLLASVALVSMAATSRLIPVMYTVVATLVVLAAAPRWDRATIRRGLVIIGGIALLVLPHALLILIGAFGGDHTNPDVPLSIPMPWDLLRFHGDWDTVMLPPWWLLGGLGAMALVAAALVVRRHWRRLVLVVAVPLLVALIGRISASPIFENQMRHQLIGLAFMAIPLGALASVVVEWGSRYVAEAKLSYALYGAALLLGLLGLVVRLDGATAVTITDQQYQIIDAWVDELPDEAIYVPTPTVPKGLGPIHPVWFVQRKPSWKLYIPPGEGRYIPVGADEAMLALALPADVPRYSVVDMICVSHWEAEAPSFVETPLGELRDICASVLTTYDTEVLDAVTLVDLLGWQYSPPLDDGRTKLFLLGIEGLAGE